MKSNMRQWRRLVLVGMLAWVLLFLALLSYFLDARVDEPLTSAGSLLSQHPDTRRLASIQASHHQHAIMGSRPELTLTLTTTYPGDEPEPEPSASSTTAESSLEVSHSPNSAPYAIYGSQEASRQDYLDPQSLAAWSSFGTENVGSHSDPAVQSRERTSQTTEYQNHVSTKHHHPGEEEEEDDRENEDEELENRVRTTADRRAGGDSSDLEEYYFSKSASVVQRLWRGRVSAGMLSPRLQRAMKDYVSANKHHVSYAGRRRAAQNSKELLCQMKAQARLRTVDGSEQPFSSLGWARLVPSLPLEHLYKQQDQSRFKSCAVVTSAGAILRSGLGKEIDTHDAVLRFNAAPTEGYVRDVGSKTTIRIINSQILANPKHRFNASSIYKNVTLVAWDPAPYTVNLQKWYGSPDYNLFGPYVEHRKLHPGQPFYILHPSYVWQLWDVIQGNTQENIQPNPPSSGFIGILLMMALCEQVHVYEYIPSMRQTDLCHYHERYYDAACTLGAYHPLLYEKSLIQRINTGPERDLRRKGRVTLPGFSTVNCDI
ncbi:beta-galactoside alpha-2,6-sialyltransferase 2-like [Xiphias gladius]|uniref:beta-galactoside alpha-2,6-sialyltransferase 2-like n=1 Tax=Xiphias gladius TaxID=8245 RepID=UPI001A995DF0|nr:beta-galactoside alpha-2,6-sialyltransferase 2-like [Xiphias gladius]XP_040004032.1 beta-galactoside alpha-2,6-sialyltransferase 2-like [Xiphias gladius]XP_040004034.1 beta-galactoside alpha-2,6-sialyltransferase 2-like [Xiphias gladius]